MDQLHTANKSYNMSTTMNNSRDLGNTTAASGQSKAVSNAMKALQDKTSNAEAHNIELQNKIKSLQK